VVHGSDEAGAAVSRTAALTSVLINIDNDRVAFSASE
jgi:hypothetical protein